MKLSASNAWDATSAFLRRHGGLVFTVALAFLALPSILAAPWLAPLQQAMLTGGEAATEAMTAALPIFIPILLISLLGTLAIYTLALRPGISVGEALAHGLRRLLPAIGVTLIIGLLAALVAIPLGIAGAVGAGGGPAVAGLLLLLLIPVFVYVFTRLYLAQVAVVDGLGPIAAVRRGWEITRGNVGRLFLLLLVLFVVALIVYVAGTFIFGGLLTVLGLALGGQELGAFLGAAAASVLSALITAVILVFVAQAYRQLAGDVPAATVPRAGTGDATGA